MATDIRAQNKIDREKKAKDKELEEYRFKASMGGSDFEGATKSGLGQQLGKSISESLSGVPSNLLQRTKTAGLESLGRKAQDLRGASAQNAIENNLTGQGGAVRASARTEESIYGELAGFHGQMGMAAAQEEAGARSQGLQYLGLGNAESQISEMKRQAIVGEGRADEMDEHTKNIDLINALGAIRDASPGAAAGITDEITTNVLGRDLTDAEKQANLDQEKSMETLANTQNFLNIASDAEIRSRFSVNEKGEVIDSNGNVLDSASASLVGNKLQSAGTPDFGEINSSVNSISLEDTVANVNLLSPEEWSKLTPAVVQKMVDAGEWIDPTTDASFTSTISNTHERGGRLKGASAGSAPWASPEALRAAGLKEGSTVVYNGRVYQIDKAIKRQIDGFQGNNPWVNGLELKDPGTGDTTKVWTMEPAKVDYWSDGEWIDGTEQEYDL